MKITLIVSIALLTFLGITKAAPTDDNAPQVLVEAKFIEVSEEALALLAHSEVIAASSTARGTLNDVQSRAFFKKVEGANGVDMLAAPRVICRSGQEGKLEIGRDFAYTDAGGKASTKNLGTKLTVLPKVTGQDQIDLELFSQVIEFEGFVEFSEKVQQPIFSDRKLTSNVSVTSGQTVFLGFPASEARQTTEDRSAQRGIPQTKNVTRHTMVFVTARLVDVAGGEPK